MTKRERRRLDILNAVTTLTALGLLLSLTRLPAAYCVAIAVGIGALSVLLGIALLPTRPRRDAWMKDMDRRHARSL